MTGPFHVAIQAVVRDDEGRWLVLRRSPDSPIYPELWDLPGGKLDPGETMDRGLIREVLEETGLDVRIERVAGATGTVVLARTVVHVIFETRARPGEVRLSREHGESRWVSPGSLGELDLTPQVRAFLEDG